MKYAKLHLVPALLLMAAVWLEIVASEYDAVYEGLLGRVVTPDFINQLTGSKGQTSNSNCGSVAETPSEQSEIIYTDYPEEATDEDKELTTSTDDYTSDGSFTPTRGTQDYYYDSSPVSSIGRNVEHNRANAIYMARNQQTNHVRQRNPSRRRKQQRRRNPSRRRTQQRRRRQKRRRRPSAQRRRRPSAPKRKRPSAQKRKRPNRNNSNDRRRRRRGGQRKQHRRVIVRRRQANKRHNGERVERPPL